MLTVPEIYERKKQDVLDSVQSSLRYHRSQGNPIIQISCSFEAQSRLYSRLYKLYSIHTNNIDDNKGRYSQGCTQGGVL